jgi:hypothetical protein
VSAGGVNHPQTREQGLHELVRFVAPSIFLQPVLTISVSIMIARSLGPEGRGAYGVLATMVSVLPLVTAIGFENAVRFWSARGEVDWRSLLRTASLLAVVIGILTASLALLSGAPSPVCSCRSAHSRWCGSCLEFRSTLPCSR